MTTRPRHRALTQHLREWNARQVSDLLERRPDLVHPLPPSDVAQLAHRAQEHRSVTSAIAATTLAESRLLQLVVCCRPDVPMGELAGALPEEVSLADIEEPLSSLEATALLWRHDGRLHCSGTLRHVMPTTLGPPLQSLVKDQTVDYLKSVITTVRTTIDEQGLGGMAPARATGPGGRPPRKAELMEELESLLVVPQLVEAVLASGPGECAGIAAAMAEGHPAISVDHPMYFSRYSPASYYRRYPTFWLYERGLLFPLDGRTAVQPREVGVALRGGRPVADLALDQPVLFTGTVDAASVDASAAERAIRTLDHLADLFDLWSPAPVKTLKNGGLGATVLRQVAATLGVEPPEAARLVELASLAGLLDTTTSTRKEGRRYVAESFVGPSSAAASWTERPVAERWAQLTTAWMRAEHWPSASGQKEPDRKTTPVLSVQHAVGASDHRRDVLDVLASLQEGQRTTREALAASVYWRRPQQWHYVGVARPVTVIEWTHDEAEMLGLSATGALSTFGRALLAGDRQTAERALEAALPETAASFTLQADLTATVFGALDRAVLVELRLLADVESTGGATTFRFSEASLRRALDAGRDGDAILAFLEAHAAKGVPKSLTYLVGDVARRYGHLHVGSAGCFVTSDDPAVLADACSHRRTRKLALRLLAPTVAASPHSPAKVIDGLREAGFLPTGEGYIQGDTVSVEASRRPDPGGGSPGRDLPEPFAARSRPQRPPPALDPEVAARLAEAIIAGPSPADKQRAQAKRASPWSDQVLFSDHDELHQPESLDPLLQWAFDNSRVLAISLEDDDQLSDTVLLAVTGWEPDQVIGIDLSDGTTRMVPSGHIAGAADLGPVDELANVVALGSGRSRSGPHRSSRSRR